ncbi:MAG: hypothetical protein ABSC00_10555 [Acidimicrobiales bacterium]|jgi:hypothetical protein
MADAATEQQPSPLPAEIAPSADTDFYVAHPSARNTRASEEALQTIASRITTQSSHGDRTLDVVLTHLDHQGLLSPKLQLFNLLPVENGSVTSPFQVDEPVRFVALLNTPVSLQVESVLTSLSKLVTRQVNLTQVMAGRKDVSQIDLESSQWDAAAQNRVVDVLRHGWQVAGDSVAQAAGSEGFAIRVTYQRTAEPDLEIARSRLQALRRAYNRLTPVKDAVDRFVGVFSSSMQLRSHAQIPDSVIDAATEHMSLGHVRQCIAQAVRDQVVTGNGYVAFTQTEPITAYNLSPDTAEVISKEKVRPTPGAEPLFALHLRGFNQLGNEYGLSLLEPVLQQLQLVEMFEDLAKRAEDIPEPTRQSIDVFQGLPAMRERAQAQMEEAVSVIFSNFLSLPAPPPGLYFTGTELFPSNNAPE